MSKTDWIGPTERAHYRGLADDTQAEIERAHAVALLWNEVWQLVGDNIVPSVRSTGIFQYHVGCYVEEVLQDAHKKAKV